MEEDIGNFVLGLFLFLLYLLMYAIQAPLERLSNALATSQTLALIATSEALCILPFFGIVRKNWSIITPKEWLAYGTLSVLLACNFFSRIYCSKSMTLGKVILIPRTS